MDPEEDHGHVLGRCDAPSGKTTLTEICVPLHGGQRMILRAWEFLSLKDPTVKYLQMITTTTIVRSRFHQLLNQTLL